MGKVGAGFSMSLDGFIADPNDDTQHVFSWMFKGDTELNLGGQFVLKMGDASIDRFQDMQGQMGVIVSGRGMFDTSQAWGGQHPLGVHCFVVTHNIPDEWADAEAFTFVTDGVESAIKQAKQFAEDKTIGVGGANIAQQCLKLGLLDEISIDLVPVLLGEGVPLFKHLGIEPLELECTSVVEGIGVTHLTYRVVK
jgi:dihydrofolate reductase